MIVCIGVEGCGACEDLKRVAPKSWRILNGRTHDGLAELTLLTNGNPFGVTFPVVAADSENEAREIRAIPEAKHATIIVRSGHGGQEE